MSRPEISFFRFSTFITGLLSFILGLSASGVYATSTTTPLKVLAFGDSITAGYNLPTDAAYPSQLQKLMQSAGIEVAVTNAGVSGDTSAQGLRRLDWNLKSVAYDWVLLCLGANDGLRQLPITQMKANLSAIIEKLQSKKIKIVLMGMRMPLNFSLAYRKDFEAVFPALAKKYSLPYVPFALEGVALDSKMTLNDQIHPNVEGHKKVADNVWKVWKQAL